jgi:hypothetical protein
MRLLAEGKFTEAWPRFEARRRFSKPAIFEPQIFCPEWASEGLSGKTITVDQVIDDTQALAPLWAEQHAAVN